jgi:hypothetical protein
MARVLTLDDVRFSSYKWRFTATPLWAYARDKWGSPEPIPTLWAGLLAELRALARAGHEAHIQRRLKLGRRVADGTASADEKSVFGILGRWLPEVPVILAGHYFRTRQQCCYVCHELFFATWPTRYCSRRCLRARWRRRRQRSRTKVLEDLRCGRCGGLFTPTRSDARYCSLRCRVAAHRARHQ